MANYPKKSRSHLTSARGELVLRRALPTEWSVLVPQEDYGEDFVIDVFEPNSSFPDPTSDEHAVSTGMCFGIQLKTVERSTSIDGYSIPVDLKTSTLNYLANRPYPTFLILCLLDGRIDGRNFSLAPAYEGIDFDQLYFANLNVFARFAKVGVVGNANSKNTRVNVPLANSLDLELNRRKRRFQTNDERVVSRFSGLLNHDPLAEQIELCRIASACKWNGLHSVLRRIYDDADSTLVRAEALLALGLRNREIDLGILRTSLFGDDYMLVASALMVLGWQRVAGARDIVLEFAKKFPHRWFHLNKVSSDMDPAYRYGLSQHYELLVSSMMQALCMVAGEDDRACVDQLLRYWAKPDRTAIGGYAAPLVLELYRRSIPEQKVYIADRLQKWIVGLKVDLGRQIDRGSDQDAYVAQAIDRLDHQFDLDERD